MIALSFIVYGALCAAVLLIGLSVRDTIRTDAANRRWNETRRQHTGDVVVEFRRPNTKPEYAAQRVREIQGRN